MQMVVCEVRVHLKYVAQIKEREEARIKYRASTISTVCEQKKNPHEQKKRRRKWLECNDTAYFWGHWVLNEMQVNSELQKQHQANQKKWTDNK